MNFDKLTDSILKVSRNTFGEMVSIVYEDGEREDVKGIFENDHFEVDQAGAAISTGQPMIDFRIKDLLEDPKNIKSISVRNFNYRVDDIQRDGRGSVTLILTRFSDAF